MKPYPGLTEEQTEVVKARVGRLRCGECEACKLVKDTGRVLSPNPPFSHANTATVETWNMVLHDNPCVTWED